MYPILFLLATYSNNAHSSEFHMNYEEYDSHDNYWKVTPEIVICKNKTIFTKEQIKYALDVWGEKYTKLTTRENCSYENEFGKIKITDGKHVKGSDWGFTASRYSDSIVNQRLVREHRSAVIHLDRNITNIELLIHELGHAFGYDHYDDKKDIMNAVGNYISSGNYPY